MELANFVALLALGIGRADAALPVALNKRSGVAYQAGIGPHTESETTTLALSAVPDAMPAIQREVPYPTIPRSRCDLVISDGQGWAIEIKMLRLMGDNGKPNDNMLMHILSPYPVHRSAVTDCAKLLASGFPQRKAVVVFGYDYDTLPMDPAIEAFEALASKHATLTSVPAAGFDRLAHPVHRKGRVFGWELGPPSANE